MYCCRQIIDGNKFLMFLNFFDVISKFFRCFFSMFCLFLLCLFYIFAFLCFVALCFVIDPYCQSDDCMPTKQSNAQHLVEYKKKLHQGENQKSGNVMQQPMHYYVCGINLRSESSLVLSDLLFP